MWERDRERICDSCSIFASLLYYCSSPCLLWRVFKYKRCNVFTHWIYDLFWYVFTIMGRLQNIKVTIKFHRFYRSIYLCEYFFSSFHYFFSVCRMVVFVVSSLSDFSQVNRSKFSMHTPNCSAICLQFVSRVHLGYEVHSSQLAINKYTRTNYVIATTFDAKLVH